MNKKDFAIIFTVRNANPNGDPLNENRPRQTFDGYGEVSDVCIKRKIRNRLLDLNQNIFVQSDDKKVDEFKSLKERLDSVEDLKKTDANTFKKIACEEWFDVRAFGQVFPFKGDSKSESVSIGIRGPVAIQSAISVLPVNITSTQITKSVNLVTSNTLTSDRMGMKHRVDFGVYVCYGTINSQLAEQTGFTDKDAELFKQALVSLFENDSSAARPEGTMEVNKVIWWEHNCKSGQYSSAKVHRSLKVIPNVEEPKSIEDFTIHCADLEGLAVEELEGH